MRWRRSELWDRTEFVLERVRGTRVVSVGLGGQVGSTDYSFDVDTADLGDTFSAQLARSAAHTTFIDISEAAIAAFSQTVDADYHLADITAGPETWPQALRDTVVDHVVLGEVLEHLDSPGPALRHLSTLLAPGGSIIITVPNSFNLSVVARIATGHENVHPEHVAYYSASTLTRLLAMADLAVEELGYYRTRRLRFDQIRSNPLGFVSGVVAEALPQYARGVIAVAGPADPPRR